MKTKSEDLFEGFLAINNLLFEKIKEDISPRPDYRVSVGGSEIIFELKELAEDGNFGLTDLPSYQEQFAHRRRPYPAQDRKLKEADPIRGQARSSLGWTLISSTAP
jgi:hypothetical protein